MYHAMGISVFSFLEAILTFEHEHMKIASAHLKKCLDICNKNRSKTSLLPKDLLTRSADYYNKMTDQEAHAELCYAEMLLLKSILTFVEDETLKNLMIGGIKIRSCYNCYKTCGEILKHRRTWESPQSKVHFESGVKMGIGTFNLMISLLPQRVIKLLEFIGFSGNKASGLADLVAGYEMKDGLRRNLSVMTLLGYHLIVCTVVCYQDGDLEFADAILQNQLQIYPNGLWFLFFKGRLEFMKGNLESAINWYNKSITVEEDQMWNHFNHICCWELLWVNCLKGDFAEAYVFAKRLFNESKWSRTIYLYQKSVIVMQFRPDALVPGQLDRITDPELRAEIEKELSTLDANMEYTKFFKQRIAGKSIPAEKFVIKRAQRYAEQKSTLVLPVFELAVVWNLFKCFQTKDKTSSMSSLNARNARLLQDFLKLFEQQEELLHDTFRLKNNEALNGYYHDNIMLIGLLKGVCLKYLNLPLQAMQQLQNAMQNREQLKEDHFLTPYCIVEMALITGHDLNDFDRALAMLEDAKKNYSNYSLESRLHFRIHAATTEFKLRVKERDTPPAVVPSNRKSR